MRIENEFKVPLPVGEAWALLLDVPTVAPCMPGVQLTEVVDPRTFRGVASVKLGPVQLALRGEAVLKEVDEAGRRAVVEAQGTDAKGRGAAKSKVEFRLVPEGAAATRVEIVTDLGLTGMIAQYGRASGLIGEVANQILTQFSANLARQIAEQRAAPAGQGGPGRRGGSSISGFGLLFGALRSWLRRWLRPRHSA